MARRKATPSSDSLTRITTRPGQAEHLLQAGLGSAFAIARTSLESLMKRVPGLSDEEARSLHQRASALAVLAARHYREQRLTAAQGAGQPWRTGLRALVEGPTYESQFSPNWNDSCPPGAIEATTSPAAYLTALFQWVTEVIEALADTEEGKPVFLAQRRPDLAGLVLDNHSLERVEPTIGIVNEILEGAARRHLDDHNQKTRSVDDALLETRYPFGLPFERYMSQINGILADKNQGLGSLIRQLDPEFPYFCRDGLHSQRSDDALQMDTGLGPEQRALLLEAAYFPIGARRVSARSVQTRTNPRSLLRESLHTLQAGFYPRHYGVAKAEDLLALSAFCLRTGLDQEGVESLLSIQRHAPLASANVPGLAAPTPAQFGSVYINAATEPAIGVSSAGNEHTLSDWSNDHFDRMQRMTRLARWLELSFGDADLLLDAALQAEYGSSGRGREISENTLRALGLFRRLRRDFKVSAEDFAALLQGVALYGRGSQVPQFDRVFNDPTLFSEPLILDDSPFNIVPGNEVEYRRVHHLCAALGLDYETYLFLARSIAQGWGEEQLRQNRQGEVLYWSHAVVSAFYRLARLPAWLGLNSIEALALLQLIGDRGHQYVLHLVRTRLAIHQHSDLSDTLSVVQALLDTVHWCREHELSVTWLYQHLMPLAPVAAASDRELDLLRQINGRMLPSILDQAVFRDAGLPMISGSDKPLPIDWLKQLEEFVSAKGLIRELDQYPDIDLYEAALKATLERIVGNLELEQGPEIVMRVFQLVMDARSAQHSLVWESLASTFGGSAELNQEVLAWAGGSGHQLLHEVLRLFNGDTEPLPIPIGDDVLALFARLGHRMGIVTQLSLSPLAVRSWRLHPQWFEGAEGEGSGEITFARLHLLTQYRYLLTFTHQAEQALLDYLKLVNNLPPDLTAQDLQLIREDAAGKIAAFTGFGVRDILETALEITEHGIIATLRQLDHLVRVRKACTGLQLGTGAALELSRLRSNSSRQDYRAAAENALGSLTAEQGHVPPVQGELGQSEASWIVVDTLSLVARAGGKARCLLTVRNFLGQPMPGITVVWDTSLSHMGTPSSITTDENGQVENHLLAGEEMGTAQVVARFGLGRQVLAPLVVIDCEDDSLYFRDLLRAPDKVLAGNLGVIEYSLQALDIHGNPGRDRVVEWSTDLGTFERPQTRTDVEGFASARLRSLSSGQAEVVARLPVNGEEETYEAVTFIEQLYFQYVRFSGPVAVTQTTEVIARVVNLDGSPQKTVTVLWSADIGTFEADRSITDADGIARIGYSSKDMGEVTVTVKARYNNEDLLPLSTGPTTIHNLPTMVEMEPAEQFYALRQTAPAYFRVRLEPAAAGYPVTWWAGEELLATTTTSADGRAFYQTHFNLDQLGEHSITVRSVREGEQFTYKVQVVQPHVKLTAEPAPDDPGIILSEPDRLVFAVDPGLSSSLLIFAERFDGVGDDGAFVTFSLDAYADPVALGVVFDPPLGQVVHCDPEGKATLRIDCTDAAFLPTSDPSNNHIRLHATSNLGVKLSLWIGLRYFVEVQKSPLHFFRWPTAAALSGRLARRNGTVAPILREGQRKIRLTLEGAQAPLDVELLAHEQETLWLHAPAFAGAAGQIGAKCSFEALGDLAKRVHFVGSPVFEAKTIISDATLSLTPVADPGLVEQGDGFLADYGETYGFELQLSAADGPVAGVPLLAAKTLVNGVEYLSGVTTDADGKIAISFDTRAAVFGRPHGLDIALGALSRTLALNVFVLVATEGRITATDKRVGLLAQYRRHNGKPFKEEGSLGGLSVFTNDEEHVFTVDSDQEPITISVYLDMQIPGTLRLDVISQARPRWRLLEPNEFAVSDGMGVDFSS